MTTPVYGVLAKFETTKQIYNACKKVRDRGYTRWDAYTPFAVHGLDKAAGLQQSKLPWIVLFVGGFAGLGSFLLWTWMNAVDYKFVIAGKPFFSWEAYFLPGFEVLVLTSAVMCFIGLLLLNKMPQWYHPLCRSEVFKQATDDKFFIVIESKDPKFSLEKTQEFCKELGASHVEIVAGD